MFTALLLKFERSAEGKIAPSYSGVPKSRKENPNGLGLNLS